MKTVDNAIIMAAGTASRFAPLSYERPKALIEVKGEILLERQIRQLLEAGVPEIILVVGYQKEKFLYLQEKFGVQLVENPFYLTRNNHSSIWAVRDRLANSYICSSDNYFSENPFEREVEDSYYAAVYAHGKTAEWCMTEDDEGYIDSVTIGGENAWYMLGHTFWSEEFSRGFLEILERIYPLPETAGLLWEAIFAKNLNVLKMKIRKYPESRIFEFDTLDELRQFDPSYRDHTRSAILSDLARRLSCGERDILEATAIKTRDNAAVGFTFRVHDKAYRYEYQSNKLGEIEL
ncbi:MAG: NTP transferase domain-containing protein [Clostridia bacterium]|nr:NTP transferase domain-containing protein [Clostridia bacterium]